MNQTYTIKNFRVFDEQGATFEMAPVTILTGCNSSGKSSVTKSLILLNDMFARILRDYRAGAPCYLEDYPLRLNSGAHKLGKFATLVNDKSSKEEFAIEYTGKSYFTDANITVQITFACDKSKEDGNGRMVKIAILDEAKSLICEMDFNTGTMTCNFVALKDKFFVFTHYASLYKRYKPLREKYDNKEHMTEHEFKELQQLEGQIGKAWLSVFYFVMPQIYKRDHLQDVTEKCDFEDIAPYKSLFYIDALKWLDGYKKVDVRRIVDNHIKRSVLERLRFPEQAADVKAKIKLIIDEFYRSDFATFREFYVHYEDLFLSSVKMEFMHNEDDSAQEGSFISKIERSLAYEYAGFNSYMSFIKEGALTFENDVEMFWENETLRFVFIVHYMRLIASYEDYVKACIDDGFNTWFNTPTFDAMILYLCNIVEDVLVDAPSFINAMDFVDAHRAHVQRLYDVQDTSSFNTLIQQYLAEKVEHPERDLFDVYNVAILRAQEFQVKEIGADGKPILDRPVIPGIMKYTLKTEKDYSRRYKKGQFIKKWLQKFDIADDICFPLSAEGAGVSVALIKNGKQRNLADYGFGITQLVAIMLQIEVNILKHQREQGGETIEENKVPLRTQEMMQNEVNAKTELGKKVAPYLDTPDKLPKELLLDLLEKNGEEITSAVRSVYKVNYVFDQSSLALEEPETHLHPKYQSMLADMFYDAYVNYNIKFLVETHSEYLVRRTQALVAGKYADEKELAEKCPFKVYYLPNPEEGKPYDLEYQTSGRFLRSFGDGFYDESAKWTSVISAKERMDAPKQDFQWETK